MERVVITGTKVSTFKETCEIFDKKSMIPTRNCWGPAVGQQVGGYWRLVESLHSPGQLRIHAVRPLYPEGEKRAAFNWQLHESRAWSGWISHGAV